MLNKLNLINSKINILELKYLFKKQVSSSYIVISNHSYRYLLSNIHNFLSEREKSDFYELQPNKERLKSYLLGRFVAKKSLLFLDKRKSFNNEKAIEITWGKNCEPLVNIPGISVSISHNNNYAVAASYYRGNQISIDIELICKKRAKIVESQMSKNEINMFIKDNVHKIMLWTIKESLSKQLKTGLLGDFLEYEVSSFTKKEGYIESYFTYFPQYKAISFHYNNLILTILLLKSATILSIL